MKKVHLEIVLGTIFTILSIWILTDMTINEEARLEEFKVAQRAEQIEFGAAVYHTNCTSCHGDYAQGIAGRAPCLRCPELFSTRLTEIGWAGELEDYVISIVSTGRQVSTRPDLFPGDMVNGNAAMPTWSDQFGGPLRIDQIRAVSAFVVNFQEWGENPDFVPTPVVAFDPDDPTALGRVALVINGCTACHSLESGTTVVGPSLFGVATRAGDNIDGYTAEEYILESILDPAAYLVEGFTDQMPKTFAESISEEDINNIIEFLLTLEE